MDNLIGTLELVANSLPGALGKLRRDPRHSSPGHNGLSVDRASNHRCSGLVGPRPASKPK